ncbi:MAG TPA: sigma 54-interacting transcriptional regulator, partial [Burkholderiales bacterium]|nr:sigma 54-interacting transcriptional regulator [Burkholderiales bacterium]
VEASGGTLFLDEVSEVPLSAQVKLLRALQEGAVEAVGGRKPVKVDVRIVSATNRKLLDRVKAGHFREDLFYRLHVLPLTVPPLRMRREDIPHLLRHFLARFCAEENRPITGISGEAMAGVLRTAQKAAGSTIPVLIEGESGVGKELFARAIHGTGERAAKPFVAVNCGAIPDNLVESILFGHEKGAFTGATERHTGKFVEASGGTLFLDEVSELPLSAQVKLLRALQEGAVEAVGGRKPVKVDVRIVSATNRKLLDRVKAGHFREDLFYRLHVLPLTVPPLRMRREDIPHLLRHFLARFCAEENRPITGISGEAMARLSQLDWPGNIRQLENAVYRAVVMSESDQLGLADFPQAHAAPVSLEPQDHHAAPLTIEPAFHSTAPAMVSGNEIPIAPTSAAGSLSMLTASGEMRPLEEMETEIIRYAISHYRGQMSEVARRLKIGRSTLYRKLDEAAGDPATGPDQAR